MINIVAKDLHYKELNEKIRKADSVHISECNGQRYICAGMGGKTVTIDGTPGNVLGGFLGEGSTVTVHGNVQDAVGNTMDGGTIIVHGNAGDALGYAMRGGQIFVKGNAGYRAGVHVKEYKDKRPIIVIGGHAGSFLGEYQAGGLIIVLGLGSEDGVPVGNFTGMGMHGGKIIVRTNAVDLPSTGNDINLASATGDDLLEIAPYIKQFSEYFNICSEKILDDKFIVLTPGAKNPYEQLYTYN